MSSVEKRCERTDLLVSACDHCRPVKGEPFPALYDGDCDACGRSIVAGQMIRERGDGIWIHASHR